MDALGNPLRLLLTAGQRHDSPQAAALIEDFEPQALIADKGYDSDDLIESVTVKGILAVIPPKRVGSYSANTTGTFIVRDT